MDLGGEVKRDKLAADGTGIGIEEMSLRPWVGTASSRKLATVDSYFLRHTLCSEIRDGVREILQIEALQALKEFRDAAR